MTIAQIRRESKESMCACGIEDAEILTDILLAYIFGVSRSDLLLMLESQAPMEADAIMADCIQKLANGVPVQYIMGSCFFYGLQINVGPGCFIPRSDTEVLVKAALGVLPENHGRFVDICTGSGCVSAAIAANSKNSSGMALELSYKAIDYAEENLEPYENVAVKRFDALDIEDYIELANTISEQFDVLVSNPPYIPTDDINLLSTQLHYEPETALDGGPDGLKFYVNIIKYAPIIMKQQHAIIFEVGVDQADIVAQMLECVGYSVAVFKDLGGIDRVVLGKKY